MKLTKEDMKKELKDQIEIAGKSKTFEEFLMTLTVKECSQIGDFYWGGYNTDLVHFNSHWMNIQPALLDFYWINKGIK